MSHVLSAQKITPYRGEHITLVCALPRAEQRKAQQVREASAPASADHVAKGRTCECDTEQRKTVSSRQAAMTPAARTRRHSGRFLLMFAREMSSPLLRLATTPRLPWVAWGHWLRTPR